MRPHAAVFESLGCRVHWRMREGEEVLPGPQGKILVAEVHGKARQLLLGERTALNILTRASGVASQVGGADGSAGGRALMCWGGSVWRYRVVCVCPCAGAGVCEDCHKARLARDGGRNAQDDPR
jgi:hypothetical protein